MNTDMMTHAADGEAGGGNAGSGVTAALVVAAAPCVPVRWAPGFCSTCFSPLILTANSQSGGYSVQFSSVQSLSRV